MAAQEDLDQKFPNAKSMLGAHIVATIMALSRLVGMSMPGLHSIFTGLDLKFGLQCNTPLSWKVTRHISPNVPIKISLEGQGIFAEVNAFFRPAPVKQATMREVKRVIDPNVFSGQRALVIGGSRGLGELAAKCLAAGGGEVHITYMNGKSDADKIKKAINGIGGVCKKSKLNVRDLDGVDSLIKSFKPTHIYYFSSSAIRNNIQSYNKELFDEYFLIYVIAFCRLVRIISKCVHYPFYVFYPSTVFIENEQKGFAEYINAKRDGEHQAKLLEVENSKASIFIKRLPVLKTDQTASFTAGEAKSALGIICNVLMEMR